MPLGKHLKPWQGIGVRHIPAVRLQESRVVENDPLDFRFCGKSNENRWNVAGEPTLYLAMERDVALVEWGRHLTIHRSPGLRSKLQTRNVFLLDLIFSFTLDLRDKHVWKALSLTDAPECFQDVRTARSIASYLRNVTDVQALFVPSMGFPDDLSKWCLVIFLEKLPAPPGGWIITVTKDSPFIA